MIALGLSGLLSYVEPPMMQRVYMASSSIQAKRVFWYSGILSFVVKFFIAFVGIAIFIGAPELQIQDIWGYIMSSIPPFFKGLVCISLVAMAMSTADSRLNSCAVMVSHDIMGVFSGKDQDPSFNTLWLTRLTSIRPSAKIYSVPTRG